MNNYYIYFHLNPKTKQIFYVGLGSHIIYHKYKRAEDIKKRNKHWKNYVNKHGDPIINIIHDNLNQEEACILETKYILKYGRKHYEDFGILVNESLGGQGGKQGIEVSNKTRRKISLKLKGKPKPEGFGAKVSLNRNHKEAGRLSGISNQKHYKKGSKRNNKISKKLLGRNITWQTNGAKPINKFTLDNIFIEEYTNIRQAGILNNFKTSEPIRRCCLGEQKTAFGFKWKYKQ